MDVPCVCISEVRTGMEGVLGQNTYDQPSVDFTFEFFHTPWLFGDKMQIEAKEETFNSSIASILQE
jgi:hypothetical protein